MFDFWDDLGAIPKLIIKVVVLAVIGILAFKFVIAVYPMHDNSMFPMVKDGDLCISYKLEPYLYGDVVLYKTDDGLRMGRIIARSGSSVSFNGEDVLVDGSVLSEDIFYPTPDAGLGADTTIRVGIDEVYILNDYRADTKDSRTYGPISTKDLRGKLIFVLRRRSF